MRSILRADFERWLRLDAWCVDLSAAKLVLFHDRKSKFDGHAEADSHGLIVKVNTKSGITEGQGTILHELAHLAHYRWVRGRRDWHHHGWPWRRLYIAAAEEALRHPLVMPPHYTTAALDDAVTKALRRRMKREA